MEARFGADEIVLSPPGGHARTRLLHPLGPPCSAQLTGILDMHNNADGEKHLGTALAAVKGSAPCSAPLVVARSAVRNAAARPAPRQEVQDRVPWAEALLRTDDGGAGFERLTTGATELTVQNPPAKRLPPNATLRAERHR